MTSEMKVSDLQRRIARLDKRCLQCTTKRGVFACESECKEAVTVNRDILNRQITAERR